MIKLVFHNVIKHKFLFILIGIMVVMFSCYLIVGLNLVFSISKSMRQAVAENMTGDVIVASSDVKTLDVINKDGEKRIAVLSNADNLLEFLRNRSYVECASPRLRVWGMVKSLYNQIPMMITGVDPVSEPNLLPRRVIDTGQWVATSNEINLYYRHSDLLSLTNGDNVGISVTTIDGYQNFNVAKLVGIVDYKDLSYYTEFSLYAFVTLDFLNNMLMSPQNLVSEVLVRLKDPRRLESLYKDMNSKFGKNYRLIRPEESASLISGINKLTYFCVYFVAFILLVMVFLCSSFLVSLSIENRRQEIGIYQALGVKKWRVGLLFGSEFLLVLFVFGLIGIFLGVLVMKSVSANGIEASILPLQLIFGRSILYIQNLAQTYLTVILLLLVTFIGNTVYAIMKLSKLDPVEVMRDL